MSRRNPAKFPTLEEYQAALRCYPDPVWPSVEAVMIEEGEDPLAARAKYEASWLARI